MTANLPCVSSPQRLVSAALRLVLASLLTLTAMAASADSRDDFLAAEQALKEGDRARFESLADTLREYPLYPYLRFADLTGNLKATPDAGPIMRGSIGRTSRSSAAVCFCAR